MQLRYQPNISIKQLYKNSDNKLKYDDSHKQLLFIYSYFLHENLSGFFLSDALYSWENKIFQFKIYTKALKQSILFQKIWQKWSNIFVKSICINTHRLRSFTKLDKKTETLNWSEWLLFLW